MKRQLLLTLILILAALFPSAAAGEAATASARAYDIAVQQYTRGEYDTARAIFEQCDGYGDSGDYITLIDARTAVDVQLYDKAIDLLDPLARTDFLDSPAFARLVKGMRAEAEGEIPLAALYYTRLGTLYGAPGRLLALQEAFPEWFPDPFALPEGAMFAKRALLMHDNAMVFASLDKGGLLPSFSAQTELRVLSFALNPLGTVFACVVPPDAPPEDTLDTDIEAGLSYIEANILHYIE